MSSTAVQSSARNPARSLTGRTSLPHIDSSNALIFGLWSPISKSAARAASKRPCPPPAAGFKRLLYVNSLILKVQMASFGQNCAPRQLHNSAQIRLIVHNCAQTGGATSTRFPRTGKGGPSDGQPPRERLWRRLMACPT
jgi:hypothetical protein